VKKEDIEKLRLLANDNHHFLTILLNKIIKEEVKNHNMGEPYGYWLHNNNYEGTDGVRSACRKCSYIIDVECSRNTNYKNVLIEHINVGTIGFCKANV
jgi:hypothetical protein